MRLLIFGFGFSGRALARRLTPLGWSVAGVGRSDATRDAMRACGVRPVGPGELEGEAAQADAVLVAAPPDADGCPGLRALAPVYGRTSARPDWIGYLSTTGVYGDRGGGWVFEDGALNAQSRESARRVGAEREWLEAGHDTGLTVGILRLPGIYGPGRSPLDRLRAGTATRTIKPGQVFSRIHVDDLAAGLHAAIRRPRPGAVYNLCDDEPACPAEVTAHAAGLLGLAPPPAQPFDAGALSPMQARFWAESKRVSNALAKAELGWRPAFVSYREGLAEVLAAERTSSSTAAIRRATS